MLLEFFCIGAHWTWKNSNLKKYMESQSPFLRNFKNISLNYAINISTVLSLCKHKTAIPFSRSTSAPLIFSHIRLLYSKLPIK